MTGFCLQARHPRHRNSDSVPENIAVFCYLYTKVNSKGKVRDTFTAQIETVKYYFRAMKNQQTTNCL